MRVQGALQILLPTSWNPHKGGHYKLHFTGKETEASRAEAVSLRWPSEMETWGLFSRLCKVGVILMSCFQSQRQGWGAANAPLLGRTEAEIGTGILRFPARLFFHLRCKASLDAAIHRPFQTPAASVGLATTLLLRRSRFSEQWIPVHFWSHLQAGWPWEVIQPHWATVFTHVSWRWHFLWIVSAGFSVMMCIECLVQRGCLSKLDIFLSFLCHPSQVSPRLGVPISFLQ